MHCFCGPEFDFQHPYGGLQPCVIPVQRYLTLSSGLHGTTQAKCTDTPFTLNTFNDKKNIKQIAAVTPVAGEPIPSLVSMSNVLKVHTHICTHN